MDVPTGFTTTDKFTLVDCSVGSYCTNNVAQSCPTDYYCPQAAEYIIPCGRTDASSGTLSCADCPVEKYCPGDGLVTPIDCIGTVYNEYWKLQFVTYS
jgi:hypothetical protein